MTVGKKKSFPFSEWFLKLCNVFDLQDLQMERTAEDLSTRLFLLPEAVFVPCIYMCMYLYKPDTRKELEPCVFLIRCGGLEMQHPPRFLLTREGPRAVESAQCHSHDREVQELVLPWPGVTRAVPGQVPALCVGWVLVLPSHHLHHPHCSPKGTSLSTQGRQTAVCCLQD